MQIQNNVDLNSLNTLHLKSTAEYLVELKDVQDLHKLQNNPEYAKLPWFILGGGSNLVLPSRILGLVLKVSNQGKRLLREDNDFWYVQASAGENWHEFVQYTLREGYWGLENLSLIP